MFQSLIQMFHLYIILVMVVNENTAGSFSQLNDVNVNRRHHEKVNHNHKLIDGSDRHTSYIDSNVLGPRIDEDCYGQIEFLRVLIHRSQHLTVVKLKGIEVEQYTDVPALRPLLVEALSKGKAIKLITNECHSSGHWFGSFQILSN